MKRPSLQKIIASAVVIGAVLGTASVAQASPDIRVSIGLPGLPVLLPPPPPLPFLRPEPVYVQPRPVYVQPQPVYQAPAPVTVYERPWGPSYRYEAERERQWRYREWQRREWERHHRHDWDRAPHHDRRGWD